MDNKPKVGLVLPGGGARAAYQVGVLKAVSEIWEDEDNPFPVITGTSAGAINAVTLAANCMNFHQGVERIEGIWKHFHVNHVYRTDVKSILRSTWRWLSSMTIRSVGITHPPALLDNSPLRKLLERHVQFARIQQAILSNKLDAVAVTASDYGSAHSVTFYEGRNDTIPWNRARREGRPVSLNLNHIMATSAIPMIFPPVRIGNDYYADGSIRQTTPLSPAIHLGAERIMVVGLRANEDFPTDSVVDTPPSIGQIIGYMLDTMFADNVNADLERLSRINQLLNISANAQTSANSIGDLKSIDCLVLNPSTDIRQLANKHLATLPKSVSLLFKMMGLQQSTGGQLASFLLFESAFTRELIQLGYTDSMKKQQEIKAFLSGASMPREQVFGV